MTLGAALLPAVLAAAAVAAATAADAQTAVPQAPSLYSNPTYGPPKSGADTGATFLLPQYLGYIDKYRPPASVVNAPEAPFTPPLGVLPSAKRLPYELRYTNLFTPPGMNRPIGMFSFAEVAEAAEAAEAGAATHRFSVRGACRNCEFLSAPAGGR